MCAFYDPSRKEVQVGGGEGLFALRGDSWIQMEGWSWPVEIAYQPPVYEPQGKRILVYGGSSKNAPGACLYEVTPDRTRELFPQQFGDWGSEDVFSDRPIAANRLEGMVYDSTRSRLIFVGTDRHTRQFGIYELADEELRSIRSENVPEPRLDAVYTYDPSSDSVIMYGGSVSGTFGPRFFTETWEIKYEPEKDAYVWRRLDGD